MQRRTLVLALGAALAAAPALAAPKALLWARWIGRAPDSALSIDHGAWTALLQRLVETGADGVARIDYGAVGAGDRAALAAYIQALEAVEIGRYGRDEQFAFWVNLYNAATLALVLVNYPVDTIRDIDISPGWFSAGPWGAEIVNVEGVALSLDDIEHRILRPIWRDPRVHYAVNCAAVGCPNLAPRAYVAADLEAMLDAAARAYVNDPRGVWFVDGELYVSSIYDWYEDDFGGDDAGVIAHLRAYAAPDLAARLESARSIAGDDYDWRLNAAR